MKKILLSTALCASVMLAANNDYKYEITPMIGGTYSEGNLDLERNYANAGLSLGFNLEDSRFDQVELGFLRTLEDVDYDNSNRNTGITRVFTNFVKDYKLSDSTSVYGLIGAGIELFDNEMYGNEDGLFGNYGVGVKYKFSNYHSVALKADIRHLIETDHGDNNLLYTVGLAIPFGKKAAPAPVEPVVVEKKEVEIVVNSDYDNDGVIDKEDKCPNSVEDAVVNIHGCEIDSDNDGVIDRLDKCPNTPKGDIVNSEGCSLTVNLNINFETDSAVIRNQYDSKIQKFAKFLKTFPSVKGKISAHTDAVGTEEYNQGLSERRAASTVEALKAYGIDESRLKAMGYGELSPKASNSTSEGRAENRRVEGSIYK